MSQNVFESTWKSVPIGNGIGKGDEGYTITQNIASTNWYNKALKNSGNRITRLRRYHEADCNSVEISRALDIMAEDLSSSNADDEEVFTLMYPDDTKTKKTLIKTFDAALDLWKKRTKFEDNLYDYARKTAKYGATFYLKLSDGSYKELPTERFVGYVTSPEDDTCITHYIYNPNAQLIENPENTTINAKGVSTTQKDYCAYPVEDLLVLKLGNRPFGESVIQRVYGVYKKLSMLEDSMVIYRVTSGQEKRVYYVDTGAAQGKKREAAMEKMRIRLAQKKIIDKQTGDIDSEFDPHSQTESIFIPTSGQGRGSRVEVLQGGQSMGETRDLEWFYRKLAAGLRIPFSMIDFQTSESGRDQFSDMRVGQVYQVEIRYLGFIRRIQRSFQGCFHKSFIEFCKRRDVIPPEDMKLHINPPMSFAKYKEIEVNQATLNVYQSTAQIGSLSKRFAMQKYLHFEQDDLHFNEESKLREMGLTDEEIKELPRNVIENIVYGDARLGEKYGVSPSEMSRF